MLRLERLEARDTPSDLPLTDPLSGVSPLPPSPIPDAAAAVVVGAQFPNQPVIAPPPQPGLPGAFIPGGTVALPVDGVDPYTGLPTLNGTYQAGDAHITAVQQSVVTDTDGKGVDVRVDYADATTGAGQMIVTLYDVSGSSPTAVAQTAVSVTGTGSQWLTFRGGCLTSGHNYVIRVEWAIQVGGQGQAYFLCP